MSGGSAIEIDDKEIENIMLSAANRSIVVAKNGIINTVHIVSITPIKPQSSIPDRPIKDLFPELRKKINALEERLKIPGKRP